MSYMYHAGRVRFRVGDELEDGDEETGCADEGCPDDEVEDEDPTMSVFDSQPEELLTPLAKLERNINSDSIFNRQMITRSLLETLRSVYRDQDGTMAVMRAMVQLSQDVEPTVRAELMEQVPHIAMFCQENRQFVGDMVPQYVLPIIVKYLTDTNNQVWSFHEVRKTAQAALLVLLEQELVERGDVEEQVVPLLLELIGPEMGDDYKTEAVASSDYNVDFSRRTGQDLSEEMLTAAMLMCKMAPLLGKDITERLLLQPFLDMCTDGRMFHIRKVCAANFGEMCGVVGTELTERLLLPKFFFLCEDGVWGVRKACAECFMQVSCAVTPEVRKESLAPCFVNLITDQSRWVRMAAFQALGPFISTFADSAMTGLFLTDDGSVRFMLDIAESQQKIILEQETPSESSSDSGDDRNFEQRENGDDDSGRLSESSSDSDRDLDSPSSPPEATPTEPNPTLPQEEPQRDSSIDDSRTRDESETVSSQDVESVSESSGHSESESASSDTQDTSARKTTESLPPTATKTLSPDEGICLDGHNCTGSTTNAASKEDSKEEEEGESQEEEEEAEQQDAEAFNSFLYWRAPLPDIELDLVDQGSIEPVEAPPRERCYALDASQLRRVGSDEVENVCQAVAETHLEPANRQTFSVSTLTGEGIQVEVTNVERLSTGPSMPQVAQVSDAAQVLAGTRTQQAPAVLNNAQQWPLSSPLFHFQPGLSSQDVTPPPSPSSSPATSPTSPHHLSAHLDSLRKQDVIPQPLLDHYLSMTDPSRAQTVDQEIARHCAYSLPSVAFTLGRDNWHCLRDTYETLANDMQVSTWKVRRTLAFSIHELAIILGAQLTDQDLIPVFDGFLKDLDEVRIGVLKHLADFLRRLLPERRREYLARLIEFLNTDNHRNWRFRYELAEQMMQLGDLFPASELAEHVCPVALSLAGDKVSDVRLIAYKLVAVLTKQLQEDHDDALVFHFLTDLITNYAQSRRWQRRQTFAFLCAVLLEDESIRPSLFAHHLLPSLLTLTSDPVPNVRIVLGKTLSQSVLPRDYFSSEQNPEHETLLHAIEILKMDSDRDVRFYASLPPNPRSNSPDVDLV
ncbi:serine/threonine-protein phosphatase 4 regulatory subunit 1-like isoform X1 [Branchiostoma lanceolatum]|uniref:serine/threonine-protein phosphatase 4 regulatory subunit 1-like isoform X1 n=1 Tax=Branchiostoma lanceolatum TaxID=7740 RepID=UPI0034533F2E